MSMDIDFCRALDERLSATIILYLKNSKAPDGLCSVGYAIHAAYLRSANRARIEAYERKRRTEKDCNQ